MKMKILNLLLIISSLTGYLEWGGNNKSFLFQGEFEVLKNLFSTPHSTIHPFTIIPMLGQILLLITLFQKRPNTILTYLGIACLSLLIGFMFIIGITSLNYKILISTLPFLLIASYTIFYLKKHRFKKSSLI